eukprot:46857_1
MMVSKENSSNFEPLLQSSESSLGFGAIDNIEDASLSMLNPSAMIAISDDKKKLIQTSINHTENPTFDDIINETIFTTYGWIFMASLFCFFDSCSWYVWILYARSLGETNHHYIAMSIYICYFLQGFATLFWARISDKWTYTNIAILLCLLLSIAYFIQSFATNFEQLLIGTSLLAISRGLFACSTAFIAKYLPLEYSIKYTSYLYAITTILYLSGPIAGGLISYFVNYQWCFIVSCGVSGFTFLFMLCIMSGSENKIKSKQIIFSNENENKNKFPICENKNKNICKQEQRFWNSISPINWFLLFCILFANASLYAIEAILSTFYTVFCKDLYPDNEHIIIIATCQVALYCLSFIVGIRIVPKILKSKFKNKNNFNFEHIILIFSQIFMIVSFGYFWTIGSLKLYWILSAIGGFIMGIVNMIQESVLLTLQPTNYSGTVAGIKQFGRYTMKAFGCLVVGMLWNSDIYYWAYVQSGLYMLSLMCTFLMIIASCCDKNKKSDISNGTENTCQ